MKLPVVTVVGETDRPAGIALECGLFFDVGVAGAQRDRSRPVGLGVNWIVVGSNPIRGAGWFSTKRNADSVISSASVPLVSMRTPAPSSGRCPAPAGPALR